VGLDVCEHLPKMAQIADKYTVLRSVNARGYPGAGDHSGGLSWKCGNRRGVTGTPKYPAYGSVVAKLLPAPRDLPAFAIMGTLDSNAPGMRENYLGPAYNPLDISLNSNDIGRLNANARAGNTFPELTRLRLNPADLNNGVSLLRSLEEQLRQQDRADAMVEAIDQFQQRAFDILRSPKLREAVDLRNETDRTKERYGVNLRMEYDRGNRGQAALRLLAARRLIEAGVPFVHVDFGYWDWHGGPGQLQKSLEMLAVFDAAMSALLTDLDERGLLDTTLVVACGEMGRTPGFEGKDGYGRGHWAPAQIVLVAGGGFRRGAVVGSTDAKAAYVKDNEYKVVSLGKTIYHLLGINPDHELYTTDNRPMRIIAEDCPLIREAIA
jgi:hypothetical protein